MQSQNLLESLEVGYKEPVTPVAEAKKLSVHQAAAKAYKLSAAAHEMSHKAKDAHSHTDATNAHIDARDAHMAAQELVDGSTKDGDQEPRHHLAMAKAHDEHVNAHVKSATPGAFATPKAAE